MTANHLRALRERDAELSALATAVDAVPDGGRLVLVEGPWGIGKTRLLESARARALAAGHDVLAARGLELERELAYGVVRQLFEPLVAALDPAARAELLGGPAAAAAAVLDPARAPAPAGAADTSFSTLHGLYWFAANLAARRPLVLVLDDLHWCDRASLRWLAYALPRLGEVPALVVAATRPFETTPHLDLLAHLAADPLTTPLHPAPLSEGACAEIVAEELDGGAVSDLLAACHAESGGNPLLLGELVGAVADREGVTAPGLRGVGAQALGRTVGMRLARLPEPAQAMASALAVLGSGAQFLHVATLAGLDEDAGFTGVLALQGADLVHTDPPLRFLHPMIEAAVERRLNPRDRAGAHLRAATVLRGAGAEPERIAAHLLKAPATGDPDTVATLRAAARAARARGSAESSVAYLARALEEPPDPETHTDLLIELGLAEALVDGPAAALHLEAALPLLPDPARRAEVSFMLGRTRYFLGRTDAAIAAYEDALADLPADDTPVRRVLVAARAHAVLTSQGADAAAPLVEGVRDRAMPDLGGRWLEAIEAFVDCQAGGAARNVAPRAERALSGDVLVEEDNGGGGLAAATLVVMHADREARPTLDLALERAHAHGSVFAFAAAKVFRARAAFLRGDLRDAEDDAEDALAAVEGWAIGIGAPYAAAYLADALMEQGRLDEAERAIARGLAVRDRPSFVHRHWLAQSAARLRVRQGDLHGGLAELLDAGRGAGALGMHNPAFLPWRSDAARVLLALGEPGRAAALAGEELVLARHWGAPRALGMALSAAGLAAGGGTGIVLLREAVEVTADSPARLEHARALIELGGALRRANQRVQARELLRDGLELASACGARPLAELAHVELQSSGGRPRREPINGPAALTASERRVCELAAGGASNREIAQTLFVTTKTVEVHLTSAYRKLDIGSRVQLASALAPA